jgi:hypothetical protein
MKNMNLYFRNVPKIEIANADVVRKIDYLNETWQKVELNMGVLNKVNLCFSTTFNNQWIETIQQLERRVQLMYLPLKMLKDDSEKFSNLLNPAIQKSAEFAAKMQTDFQPLFHLFRDVQPSLQQISMLYHSTSQYFNSINNDIETYVLTENDKIIACNYAAEILAHPDNWGMETEKLLISKGKRSHITKMAVWILKVVVTIVLSLTSNFVYDTIKSAKLRIEPVQNSNIITIIDINQLVTIIDDVPYYFEVEYIDAETGRLYSGWVSKRSVRKFENINKLE